MSLLYSSIFSDYSPFEPKLWFISSQISGILVLIDLNALEITCRNIGSQTFAVWVVRIVILSTGYFFTQISFPDCKHHNRLHPRWIPSILDDEDTTLDTRVMPVQKLVELSENSDGTLDDVIPHEVHYVEPMVTVVTDYFLNFWKPPDFQPNCSTDSDCGEGALCIIPQGHKTNKVTGQGHKGYCYCKSAYFGDGFTCIKIPRGNHRDKRIRREISRKSEEFKIQPNLFYDRSMTNAHPLTKTDTVQTLSPLVALRFMPLMEYEDEDSYLVGECADRRDCNQHAICFQGDTGHPYCKCNPGYRGNGIFCWEMIDYIKDKDQVTEMAPD
ncbi:hypothetical protein AVEN_55026-1 [Araneus ventricosus]|uniref:EGF-like domain-containing protein n=1 Tax=Araneus ventricosus TaxID=182803 RepID=A0A4Y2PKU2_ARAVE|nr:hypothetical protein AVEN_55026-1 [Araneus ventricosus]